MGRDVRATDVCAWSFLRARQKRRARPVYLANTPNRKSHFFGRFKGIEKKTARERREKGERERAKSKKIPIARDGKNERERESAEGAGGGGGGGIDRSRGLAGRN